MTLGTDVTKQVYSGKSWNREPNLCGTKRKPRIQVIRKIGRGHVTSRGPVLHLSHADYNGEQLRKLGERLARGSELHLNNTNLSRCVGRTSAGMKGWGKLPKAHCNGLGKRPWGHAPRWGQRWEGEDGCRRLRRKLVRGVARLIWGSRTRNRRKGAWRCASKNLAAHMRQREARRPDGLQVMLVIQVQAGCWVTENLVCYSGEKTH